MAASAAGREAWRPLRVLVVDDEEPIRRGLVQVLAQAGHHAHAAGSVSEAFVALEAGAMLDVALIDICLPDGDGSRIVHRIKKHELRVTPVLITGLSMDAEALVSARTGIPDLACLRKPVPAEVLIPAVEWAGREALARNEHAVAPVTADEPSLPTTPLHRADAEGSATREQAMARLERALDRHLRRIDPAGRLEPREIMTVMLDLFDLHEQEIAAMTAQSASTLRRTRRRIERKLGSPTMSGLFFHAVAREVGLEPTPQLAAALARRVSRHR